MSQKNIWEKEYRSPKLITKDNNPQSFFIHLVKIFKKKLNFYINGKKVLDLGCGIGRNSNYLASLGAEEVIGVDISKTAINIAKKRSNQLGISNVFFEENDIGSSNYNYKDNYFDLVLDITSSNSLNFKERNNYLKEVFRVLKKDSYLVVRAFNKNGDKNAHKLLQKFPGKEKDTYIIPELGLTEKVFSYEDFLDTYKDFSLINLERKTSYTRFLGQNYKRNFFLTIFKK